MKIFFIIPKNKSMFGKEGNLPDHPHVGIASLVAVLRKEKYQLEIFDQALEKNDKNLFEKIKIFQPDLIGMTIFSYCYDEAYKIIVSIKKKSKTPLVIGGPHVSAVKGQILEETKADFAFLGEGETHFLSFLQEFSKDRNDFSKLPNLIWRKGKKIMVNPQGPLIHNLDKLPFPDYEAFGLERYPCFQTKVLPLLTSRGCPYGCTYCSVRLSMGRGFRARSPENVLEEIDYWHKKGFENFDINDDCFTLDIERAKKICDLIMQKRLKIHFQLYNGIRVDRVDLELLKKLKKAGCTFIAYGCEAGNERILKVINKGITLDQVRKAVEWTNNAGIKNAVNFIIGHPQETYHDALDSIKFARSLPANFVNFYNLVPYPGTESYEWVVSHAHFLYPKYSFLKKISYRDNVPIFETEEFTKREREEIIKTGFNLYEEKVLKFRLGKNLGLIFYKLSRWPILHDTMISLLTNNQIFRKLFIYFSAKSRN